MLGFKEKRAIQKEIKIKYAELEAEKGFKAKREIQKAIKGLYVKLGGDGEKLSEREIMAQSNQLAMNLTRIKDTEKFETFTDFTLAEELVQRYLDEAPAMVLRQSNVETAHALINEYIESKAKEFTKKKVLEALESHDLETMKSVSESLSNQFGEYRWHDHEVQPLDERIIDLETTEPEDQLITKLTYAMEEIKDVITNDDATIEDWESIEQQVDLIEANEDKLGDHELYHEVINILSEIAGEGEVKNDSIYGGDLFDVNMDAVKKKEREFKTYQAWKRAVKKLNPNAKFTGDKDIDGSFIKGKYDAEWDGEVGYIVALDGVTADALTAFDELSKNITKEVFEKVENDTKKLKEANPELDAVETGTYVSRKVVNAKQLKEWVKAQGLVPVEDPHVTIVYSKKKVDLEPKDDEVIIDKITGSGILGKEKVLVLFVKSKKLTARHNRAKRLGATWDYDSYKPHITISVDGKELKELPDFEIKLGKEIIKPIKGDFSYRKGEK